MPGPSALAPALRLLMLAVLLCGFVLKPALAFAEEIHELTAHASATHGDHGLDHAPAPDDGKSGHDDDGWHLSHCCGHQAAVLPRLDIAAFAATRAEPVPEHSVAFVPTRLTAPFRPPIAA